jgi:hypothetical protein
MAGTDWRTDPLLLTYNRLAEDLMAAMGRGSSCVQQPRAAEHGGTAAAHRGLGGLAQGGDGSSGDGSAAPGSSREPAHRRTKRRRRDRARVAAGTATEEGPRGDTVPQGGGERRALRWWFGQARAPPASRAGAEGASAAGADNCSAVPLIDTFSASRVLHDTTWDGVHFANLGPVGVQQLTALLHALCAPALLAGL